jgi:hypothetical protein
MAQSPADDKIIGRLFQIFDSMHDFLHDSRGDSSDDNKLRLEASFKQALESIDGFKIFDLTGRIQAYLEEKQRSLGDIAAITNAITNLYTKNLSILRDDPGAIPGNPIAGVTQGEKIHVLYLDEGKQDMYSTSTKVNNKIYTYTFPRDKPASTWKWYTGDITGCKGPYLSTWDYTNYYIVDVEFESETEIEKGVKLYDDNLIQGDQAIHPSQGLWSLSPDTPSHIIENVEPVIIFGKFIEAYKKITTMTANTIRLLKVKMLWGTDITNALDTEIVGGFNTYHVYVDLADCEISGNNTYIKVTTYYEDINTVEENAKFITKTKFNTSYNSDNGILTLTTTKNQKKQSAQYQKVSVSTPLILDHKLYCQSQCGGWYFGSDSIVRDDVNDDENDSFVTSAVRFIEQLDPSIKSINDFENVPSFKCKLNNGKFTWSGINENSGIKLSKDIKFDPTTDISVNSVGASDEDEDENAVSDNTSAYLKKLLQDRIHDLHTITGNYQTFPFETLEDKNTATLFKLVFPKCVGMSVAENIKKTLFPEHFMTIDTDLRMISDAFPKILTSACLWDSALTSDHLQSRFTKENTRTLQFSNDNPDKKFLYILKGGFPSVDKAVIKLDLPNIFYGDEHNVSFDMLNATSSKWNAYDALFSDKAKNRLKPVKTVSDISTIQCGDSHNYVLRTVGNLKKAVAYKTLLDTYPTTPIIVTPMEVLPKPTSNPQAHKASSRVLELQLKRKLKLVQDSVSEQPAKKIKNKNRAASYIDIYPTTEPDKNTRTLKALSIKQSGDAFQVLTAKHLNIINIPTVLLTLDRLCFLNARIHDVPAIHYRIRDDRIELYVYKPKKPGSEFPPGGGDVTAPAETRSIFYTLRDLDPKLQENIHFNITKKMVTPHINLLTEYINTIATQIEDADYKTQFNNLETLELTRLDISHLLHILDRSVMKMPNGTSIKEHVAFAIQQFKIWGIDFASIEKQLTYQSKCHGQNGFAAALTYHFGNFRGNVASNVASNVPYEYHQLNALKSSKLAFATQIQILESMIHNVGKINDEQFEHNVKDTLDLCTEYMEIITILDLLLQMYNDDDTIDYDTYTLALDYIYTNTTFSNNTAGLSQLVDSFNELDREDTLDSFNKLDQVDPAKLKEGVLTYIASIQHDVTLIDLQELSNLYQFQTMQDLEDFENLFTTYPELVYNGLGNVNVLRLFNSPQHARKEAWSVKKGQHVSMPKTLAAPSAQTNKQLLPLYPNTKTLNLSQTRPLHTVQTLDQRPVQTLVQLPVQRLVKRPVQRPVQSWTGPKLAGGHSSRAIAIRRMKANIEKLALEANALAIDE